MVANRLVEELSSVVDLAHADGESELVFSRVIESARRSIGGCDGASVLLWQGDPTFVQVATHPDLAEIDAAQLQLREGPALAAVAGGEMIAVPDTLRDPRWPAFATVAVHHGVRSCVAAAFDVPQGRAVLQLYATSPGRLGPAVEADVAFVVKQTRTAMRNLRLYSAARDHAAQMQAARESSAVIEEAKGILMYAYGCDADAAFERLRVLSQRGQLKLATVARRLVDQVAAGNVARNGGNQDLA